MELFLWFPILKIPQPFPIPSFKDGPEKWRYLASYCLSIILISIYKSPQQAVVRKDQKGQEVIVNSKILFPLQSKPKKRERQKLFLECLLFYDQSDSRRNRNKPQQ